MNSFEFPSQKPRSLDAQTNKKDTLSKRSQNQMQVFFLLRLMHLLDLRNNVGDEGDEWQFKLLDRTIYSTFMDCLEQGVGDDARSLLRQREAAKQG